MMLFKKVALVVTLITIMLSSALVYAKITNTLLVLDMPNQHRLPNNFRTTSDVLPESRNLNTNGLRELHAVGSQQFSRSGLKAALSNIPAKSIVIVDLRRESHGLLNGNAVSWYGPQNAANANKTSEKIKVSESKLLSRLRRSRFRTVYKIIRKNKDAFIDKVKRDLVVVKSATSEKQLAKSMNVGYKRFYVEDFHAPREADVVRFVKFAKAIPEDTWLYFHCRAGKGRTTTFLAMYDMMKNAKKLSFDEIIARQIALGGSTLDQLPPKGSFKRKFAADRLEFLRQFYAYTRSNDDNYMTSWKDWVSK